MKSRPSPIIFDPRKEQVVGLDDRLGGVWFRYGGNQNVMSGSGHTHDELEVNVVLQGRLTYIIDNRRVSAGAGSMLWLLPTQGHLLIDCSPKNEFWVGVFKSGLVESFMQNASEPSFFHGVSSGKQVKNLQPRHELFPTILLRRIDSLAMDRLNALAQQIKDAEYSERSRSRHDAGIRWLFSECYESYLDGEDSLPLNELHPAVADAVVWLGDHATEPLANDLDQLAQSCGVSRPWLSKLFAEQVGYTLTDFRNRCRVRAWQVLIREHAASGRHLSMTEAAYASGFGSYAQCYRVIHRLTGKMPRELVKQT